MKARRSLITRWEDLHVSVQIGSTFVISALVLWFAHIALLNQPTGRGFVYGVFWAVPVTFIVVAATRSERARRLRSEGRET